MSTYQKFTKYVFFMGLIHVIAALEGMIVLPVITKFLGVASYGIWTQLRGIVTLIVPFIVLALPAALIRFLSAEKNKREIQEGVYSVLVLVFIIAFIIASLFVIFSGFLARFFECSPVLIKIFSLVIILESLNVIILDVLIAFQEMAKYCFFSIFEMIGQILLIVGAVFIGSGLYGVVLSFLLIRLITFLILFIYVLKKICIIFPTFSPIKKYLYFSLPLLGSGLSYWFVASSDRYLINLFWGVIAVGFYAPAYAMGSLLNFFIYPVTLMLTAVLPKLFDEKKMDEVKNHLKYSLKYFLIVVIPSVFGLSVLSRQLLIIFSTKEIAENAYFITPFIALSILFYGVSCFFCQILVLAKKTKINAMIWAASALLNFGLNLIFIPIFGILAAAITTFLSYLFSFGLIWYFSFKELKFEIDWQFIIKSILASVLMSLFIIQFSSVGLLNALIVIVSAAFIYGILIFLFKGISKKEIYFFKDLILNLKKTVI
jgi:O-antigen/teichoic acid export membrane protein